ncbi:1448_t:CDS:1, partial [Paraglomus brasilianum]
MDAGYTPSRLVDPEQTAFSTNLIREFGKKTVGAKTDVAFNPVYGLRPTSMTSSATSPTFSPATMNVGYTAARMVQMPFSINPIRKFGKKKMGDEKTRDYGQQGWLGMPCNSPRLEREQGLYPTGMPIMQMSCPIDHYNSRTREEIPDGNNITFNSLSARFSSYLSFSTKEEISDKNNNDKNLFQSQTNAIQATNEALNQVQDLK